MFSNLYCIEDRDISQDKELSLIKYGGKQSNKQESMSVSYFLFFRHLAQSITVSKYTYYTSVV